MGSLAFLSPWFLLGALTVAVPILLHLRRRETAPALQFSAVRFLRRAPQEQRQPRHLRDLFLLLLRAAALMLLAFAFARPYLAGADAGPGRTIVVAVDASYSMSAPGRFERARAAAQEAVSAASLGERVAILRFDDHAATASQPSLDRGLARAAIGQVAPTAGGTEYNAALAAASRLIGSGPGRVVLVTDLQRTWPGSTVGSLPEGVELEVVDVGGIADNLAVGPLRREGDSIHTSVTNYGRAARTTRAELELNERSVAEATVTVEPGRTAPLHLVARLPSSGSTRVRIDDDEGFAADNERYLVLDPPPAPRVALLGSMPAGEDTFFVRRAVEAADAGRAVTLQTFNAAERDAVDRFATRELDLVVLFGTRGLKRETREAIAGFVADGGSLLIVAGPTLDAGTLGELIGGASGLRIEAATGATFPTQLAPVDTRHPIFQVFAGAGSDVGGSQFTNAVRIVPGETARVAARFTNGLPALVEQPAGKGRVAIFASDAGGAWNTFPRQPSFVPIVLETLRYLSGLRTAAAEVLVSAVPAGVAPRPGIIRLADPARPVAVNVDLRESAAPRASTADFEAAVVRIEAPPRAEQAAVRQREASQGLWRYALLAMLGALVFESLWSSRLPRETDAAAPAAVTAGSSGPFGNSGRFGD